MYTLWWYIHSQQTWAFFFSLHPVCGLRVTSAGLCMPERRVMLAAYEAVACEIFVFVVGPPVC